MDSYIKCLGQIGVSLTHEMYYVSYCCTEVFYSLQRCPRWDTNIFINCLLLLRVSGHE